MPPLLYEAGFVAVRFSDTRMVYNSFVYNRAAFPISTTRPLATFLMTDSADLDSLYQEWLEIPAERCPPNHYALLGVDDFEKDIDVIELAAKSRGAYLHQIASGPNRKTVQDMLGKVAIARRTLLDAASKAKYDESLRMGPSDSRPDETETLGHEPIASSVLQPIGPSSSGQRPAVKSTTTAAAKRKKKSDLKYHLGSAGVLLILVGLFAFLNRGDGGRQASRVQEVPGVSPGADSASKKSDSKKAEPSEMASSSKAAKSAGSPARKSAAVSKRTQSRTTRPKKSRSSGLGGAMPDGATLDFSSIGTNAGNKGGFVPMGGVSKGPLRKDITEGDLPAALAEVDGFAETIEDSFSCEEGFSWFTVDDARLVLKPKMKQAAFLISKDTKLAKGQAVSVTANIKQGMPAEVRAGISVGRIRIGLKPSKHGANVYVREVGGTDDSITTIKAPMSPIQLLVQRHPDQTDRLDWFARSGEDLVGGYVEGPLDDAAAEVSLFVRGAKRAKKQTPWVSGWMIPEQ